MSRVDHRRRLAELEGNARSDEPEPLKPRPAPWLIERVLEACQGQSDGMLADWLVSRQVYPDDVAAWRERGGGVAADWADAGKVLRSVRGILDDPPHPQATFLLGMLHSLVSRHAPHNAGLVPLSVHDVAASAPPEPEPASPIPTAAPRFLPDAELDIAYEKLGIPNPRTIQAP